MSISHQIEALAEDIEASYGRRKAAVSDIAKETHQALGNFKRERKKIASDLKHSLASNSSRRASRVQKMLADFSSDRQEMATALNATLARETSERIDNTHHRLSHFIREHKKMARSLRSELSSFQSDLVKAVDDMRADFSADSLQARTHWEHLTKEMAVKRAGEPAPSLKAEMNVSTSADAFSAKKERKPKKQEEE